MNMRKAAANHRKISGSKHRIIVVTVFLNINVIIVNSVQMDNFQVV